MGFGVGVLLSPLSLNKITNQFKLHCFNFIQREDWINILKNPPAIAHIHRTCVLK